MASSAQPVDLRSPFPTGRRELLNRIRSLASHLEKVSQDEPADEYKHVAKNLYECISKEDRDVQLLTACCLSDLFRIYAPEAPFGKAEQSEVFQFLVNQLKGLDNPDAPAYKRSFYVLERMASTKVGRPPPTPLGMPRGSCFLGRDRGKRGTREVTRSALMPLMGGGLSGRGQAFILMHELDNAEDLVMELFKTLFDVGSRDHSHKVKKEIVDVLVAMIDEAELVPTPLLEMLLKFLAENPQGCELARMVVDRAAASLQGAVKELFNPYLLGKPTRSVLEKHGHELILELYALNPAVLFYVLPNLEAELKDSESAKRLRTARLLARLFALPGSTLAATNPLLFSTWLSRFNDQEAHIRREVLEQSVPFFLHQPILRPQISESLELRLRDVDESVRKAAVVAVLEAAMQDPLAIEAELLQKCSERLRDRRLPVRREALVRFAHLYRRHFQPLLDREGALALVAEERLPATLTGVEVGLARKPHQPKRTQGTLRRNQSMATVDAYLREMYRRFAWIPSRLMRSLTDPEARGLTEQLLEEVLLPESLVAQRRGEQLVCMYSLLDGPARTLFRGLLGLRQSYRADLIKYLDLKAKQAAEEHVAGCSQGVLWRDGGRRGAGGQAANAREKEQQAREEEAEAEGEAAGMQVENDDQQGKPAPKGPRRTRQTTLDAHLVRKGAAPGATKTAAGHATPATLAQVSSALGLLAMRLSDPARARDHLLRLDGALLGPLGGPAAAKRRGGDEEGGSSEDEPPSDDEEAASDEEEGAGARAPRRAGASKGKGKGKGKAAETLLEAIGSLVRGATVPGMGYYAQKRALDEVMAHCAAVGPERARGSYLETVREFVGRAMCFGCTCDALDGALVFLRDRYARACEATGCPVPAPVEEVRYSPATPPTPPRRERLKLFLAALPARRALTPSWWCLPACLVGGAAASSETQSASPEEPAAGAEEALPDWLLADGLEPRPAQSRPPPPACPGLGLGLGLGLGAGTGGGWQAVSQRYPSLFQYEGAEADPALTAPQREQVRAALEATRNGTARPAPAAAGPATAAAAAATGAAPAVEGPPAGPHILEDDDEQPDERPSLLHSSQGIAPQRFELALHQAALRGLLGLLNYRGPMGEVLARAGAVLANLGAAVPPTLSAGLADRLLELCLHPQLSVGKAAGKAIARLYPPPQADAIFERLMEQAALGLLAAHLRPLSETLANAVGPELLGVLLSVLTTRGALGPARPAPAVAPPAPGVEGDEEPHEAEGAPLPARSPFKPLTMDPLSPSPTLALSPWGRGRSKNTRQHLRLTAGQLLVRLFKMPVYEAMTPPREWQDGCPQVREAFLVMLAERLAMNKLPMRYMAILPLYATDHDPDRARRAKLALQQTCATRHRPSAHPPPTGLGGATSHGALMQQQRALAGTADMASLPSVRRPAPAHRPSTIAPSVSSRPLPLPVTGIHLGPMASPHRATPPPLPLLLAGGGAAEQAVQQSMMPEFVLPQLVHLLAHHPNLPDGPHYVLAERYLLFYLEAVTQHQDNISLLKQLLTAIRQCDDAQDPSSNAIHQLADLANRIIHFKSEAKRWNFRPHPGEIVLPGGLYLKRELYDPAAIFQPVLPEDFKLPALTRREIAANLRESGPPVLEDDQPAAPKKRPAPARPAAAPKKPRRKGPPKEDEDEEGDEPVAPEEAAASDREDPAKAAAKPKAAKPKAAKPKAAKPKAAKRPAAGSKGRKKAKSDASEEEDEDEEGSREAAGEGSDDGAAPSSRRRPSPAKAAPRAAAAPPPPRELRPRAAKKEAPKAAASDEEGGEGEEEGAGGESSPEGSDFEADPRPRAFSPRKDRATRSPPPGGRRGASSSRSPARSPPKAKPAAAPAPAPAPKAAPPPPRRIVADDDDDDDADAAPSRSAGPKRPAGKAKGKAEEAGRKAKGPAAGAGAEEDAADPFAFDVSEDAAPAPQKPATRRPPR
ncbi:putative Sister chromatid cohesion protein PDS5 B-B [Paratrimastix pyriformis]|uniref:Sister chromatid cohesion protein PDS5 B-B n=1 Tax=Paratrimastix pyriformis TaxID=342808 RepID=A0ABQ8UVB2_9EUKA|nr:putative Sister chromatid cohesion protein PDS5 B-B [Paratrimastix pyriformis]